ncbi:MAG: acyl-CoA dehydrogenase family protein [Alphaproteobacteria bacterium]
MTRYDQHSSPELIAAQSFYDEISERALEIEAAKRLPADLARKLNEAGLFRMAIPKAYGGPERTLAQLLRVLEAVSYADGSVGWCQMIYGTMGFMAGLVQPEWAQVIFGNEHMSISSGATIPSGRGEFVKGGIKVSGRWSWGSGAHNSDWITGATLIMDGGKPVQYPTGEPRIYMVYFSRDQVNLIENWDPSGLIGSGSGDFEVKDAFVPQDRWIVMGDTAPLVDGPLYRLPYFGMLASAHAAHALGIAQRSVDCFSELARSKIATWQTDTLAKNAIVQTSLGRAEGQLYAARATIYEIVEEVTECVTRGDKPTLEHRRRLRMASNFVIETATGIVDLMYTLGGGSAVHRTSPLQRCLRDMHVATQHGMVTHGHYRTAGMLKLLGDRQIMMF